MRLTYFNRVRLMRGVQAVWEVDSFSGLLLLVGVPRLATRSPCWRGRGGTWTRRPSCAFQWRLGSSRPQVWPLTQFFSVSFLWKIIDLPGGQTELLNINISLSILYQLSCLASYQYQYQYQLFLRGLININTLSITQKTPLSISISIYPININISLWYC